MLSVDLRGRGWRWRIIMDGSWGKLGGLHLGAFLWFGVVYGLNT